MINIMPIKIVLTGAACSGKTTIMNNIKKQLGDKILYVGESATALLMNGFPSIKDVKYDKRWNYLFQKTIISLQTNVEKLMVIKSRQENNKIILLDRGILDGAAYYDGHLNSYLDAYNLNLHKILHNYTCIIILKSVANLTDDTYDRLRYLNPIRMGKKNTVIENDKKIEEIWSLHNKCIKFKASDDIEKITNKIIEIIKDYMSREIECKYLLDKLPNISEFEYQEYKIRQGYLGEELNNNGELRIREKINVKKNCLPQYTITIKSNGDANRSECERDIDKWAFDQLWKSIKNNHYIEKTRYVVKFGEYLLEIDEYCNKKLIILECEFQSEDDLKKFKLPQWILNCNPIDVTYNPEYKNKCLSKQCFM